MMITFAFLKYANMIVFDSRLRLGEMESVTLASLAVSVELKSHFREVLVCGSFFVFFVVRSLFLLSELRLVVKHSALSFFSGKPEAAFVRRSGVFGERVLRWFVVGRTSDTIFLRRCFPGVKKRLQTSERGRQQLECYLTLFPKL